MDRRRFNHGTPGNRGGGRPATGRLPRHTISASDEQWRWMAKFIHLIRTDPEKAQLALQNIDMIDMKRGEQDTGSCSHQAKKPSKPL